MGCDEAIIAVWDPLDRDPAYIIDHDRKCASRPLKEAPKNA